MDESFDCKLPVSATNNPRHWMEQEVPVKDLAHRPDVLHTFSTFRMINKSLVASVNGSSVTCSCVQNSAATDGPYFNTDSSTNAYVTNISLSPIESLLEGSKVNQPRELLFPNNNNSNHNINISDDSISEIHLNDKDSVGNIIPDLQLDSLTSFMHESNKYVRNMTPMSDRRTSDKRVKVNILENQTDRRGLCFVKPLSSSASSMQIMARTSSSEQPRPSARTGLHCGPSTSCKHSGRQRNSLTDGTDRSKQYVTCDVNVQTNHPLTESSDPNNFETELTTHAIHQPPHFTSIQVRKQNSDSCGRYCWMRPVESKPKRIATVASSTYSKQSAISDVSHHNQYEIVVNPNVSISSCNRNRPTSPCPSGKSFVSRDFDDSTSVATKALATAVDRALKLPRTTSTSSSSSKPILTKATSRRHKVFDSQQQRQQQQQQQQQPIVVQQTAPCSSSSSSSRPRTTLLLGRRRTGGKTNKLKDGGSKTCCLRSLVTSLLGFLLIGLVCGVLMVIYMRYQLSYGFTFSAMTSSLTGALLSVGLTVSGRVRCYSALVLPCAGTTPGGRCGYLLLVTVVLIAGPLANVGVNVREVARSLACSAELSYNQSRLLSDPYGALLGPLNVTVDGLKRAVGKIGRDLKPIEDGLAQLYSGINNGFLQLSGAHKTCRSFVEKAYSACQLSILKARDQCSGVMAALGNVYNHARHVLDNFNPERWVPRPDPGQMRVDNRGGGGANSGSGISSGSGTSSGGGSNGGGGYSSGGGANGGDGANGGSGSSSGVGGSIKRQMPFVFDNHLNRAVRDWDELFLSEDRDICEPLQSLIVCQRLKFSEALCAPTSWAGDVLREVVNTTQKALADLVLPLRTTLQYSAVYHIKDNDDETTATLIDSAEDNNQKELTPNVAIYSSIIDEVDVVGTVCCFIATFFVRFLPLVAVVLIGWSVYACLRSYLALGLSFQRDCEEDVIYENVKMATTEDKDNDTNAYSKEACIVVKESSMSDSNKVYDSYVDIVSNAEGRESNLDSKILRSNCDCPGLEPQQQPFPNDALLSCYHPPHSIRASTSIHKFNKYSDHYRAHSGLFAPQGDENVGIIIILHAAFAVICFALDHSLFWLLALVQRHARPPQTAADFTGIRGLEEVAKGDGAIVQLFEEFLRTFHAGYWFGFGLNEDSDAGGGNACLCQPAAPEIICIIVVVFLYVALFTVAALCQGRSLRARNDLCGYFYPDCKLKHATNLMKMRDARSKRIVNNFDQMIHQRGVRNIVDTSCCGVIHASQQGGPSSVSYSKADTKRDSIGTSFTNEKQLCAVCETQSSSSSLRSRKIRLHDNREVICAMIRCCDTCFRKLRVENLRTSLTGTTDGPTQSRRSSLTPATLPARHVTNYVAENEQLKSTHRRKCLECNDVCTFERDDTLTCC